MSSGKVHVPARLILDPLGKLHLVPTNALDSRFIFNLSGSKVGLSLYILVVGAVCCRHLQPKGFPLRPAQTKANPL